MIILVTGATGFIGRNLILELLKKTAYSKIYVPVRSIEKLRAQFLGDGFEKIPDKVIPIVSSANNWNLKGIEPIDDVVHCAGCLYGKSYEEFQKTNVDGTLMLLRGLHISPRRIVILSSQAAAGPCLEGQSIRTERDIETPLTLYGQSKLEMEHAVRKEFSHLPLVFLRPPMVLGARDQASLPLFKMVKSIVRPKPGLKAKTYSFISVKDLVSAIFCVLEKTDFSKGQPAYFIAAEKTITDLDLIEGAGNAMKRFGFSLPFPQGVLRGVAFLTKKIPLISKKVPALNPDRIKEIFPDRWVVSSESFRNNFLWKPIETLETTLLDTKNWYVSSGFLKE